MNIKRFFIAAGILFIAFFLFLFTLFLTFPNSLIEEWVENKLNEKTGLVFLIEGFKKVFPPGFEVKKLVVLQAGDENLLFYIDNIYGRLIPSSLFSGNIKININGSIGDGDIKEEIILKIGSTTLNTVVENIGLKYIPLLNSIGFYNGIINGYSHATFSQGKCLSGFVKAEGKGIDAGRVKVQGMSMPVEMIEKAGIVTKIEDCKLNLNGLWAEGKEFSARLQGIVNVSSPFKNSPIDLTLEITPRQPLIENEPLLLLIKSYRKSLTFYSIPLKGTIENPVFIQ